MQGHQRPVVNVIFAVKRQKKEEDNNSKYLLQYYLTDMKEIHVLKTHVKINKTFHASKE